MQNIDPAALATFTAADEARKAAATAAMTALDLARTPEDGRRVAELCREAARLLRALPANPRVWVISAKEQAATNERFAAEYDERAARSERWARAREAELVQQAADTAKASKAAEERAAFERAQAADEQARFERTRAERLAAAKKHAAETGKPVYVWEDKRKAPIARILGGLGVGLTPPKRGAFQVVHPDGTMTDGKAAKTAPGSGE